MLAHVIDVVFGRPKAETMSAMALLGRVGPNVTNSPLIELPETAIERRKRMTAYHFSVTLHEDFSSAVAKTKKALGDHGFGIVSEIDMAATIKEKLGVERDPYLILGACNPGYARQAVDQEPAIGVLLPCNVVIRSHDGDGVTIDFMDPAVIMDLVGEARVHTIADEVRTRLEMTRDAIATAASA